MTEKEDLMGDGEVVGKVIDVEAYEVDEEKKVVDIPKRDTSFKAYIKEENKKEARKKVKKNIAFNTYIKEDADLKEEAKSKEFTNSQEDTDFQENTGAQESTGFQEDTNSQDKADFQRDTTSKGDSTFKDTSFNAYTQEDVKRDTSFKTYVKVKKERGTFSKVIIFLMKIALGLMLLPFIIFAGGVLLGTLGMVLGGTLALIVGGLALLVGGAFFASSLGGGIIALVISLAITCLALGFLILIIIIAGIKAGIRVCKAYSKRIRMNKAEREAR